VNEPQVWCNVELPGVTIGGGCSGLAYIARTNGFGFSFAANYTAEIPIEGVAFAGNAASWRIEIANSTSASAPCNLWVHFTPPPALAESGMPWRIISASASHPSTRNIYRNGTGNDGLRIEQDGASATWLRDSISSLVIPAFSTVVITGSVTNCEPEDLDGTGGVDTTDLSILLGQFGQPGPADFDNSGIVGPEDLAQLLGKMQGES
jgi:hypothetical protein